MDSTGYLGFHFECLTGMYFETVEPRNGGWLLSSDLVGDSYYNYFAVDSAIDNEVVSAAAGELAERDRTPAVYVGPGAPTSLTGELRAKGYQPWAVDAWMRRDLDRPAAPILSPSAHCEYIGIEARDDYVEAFRVAYSGEDASDPYGDLDDGYTLALNRSFEQSAVGYEKFYLRLQLTNSTVGIAAILSDGERAGVYGVGVVPSHRRVGIGRGLMDFIAFDMWQRGVRELFLQTESGSAVEQWYRSQGYESLFDASYLALSTD